jgi:rhamnogalacturonyl hydrolase YesR
MYFRTRKGLQLVTDVPEEKMSEYVISVGKPDQWYHVPSLAAGFLAKLYEATGDRRHLETAQRYLNFVENCGPDRYSSIRSGFLGWAAAQLYAITGNANYRRIAIAVADGLMKLQLANGSWLQMSCSEDLTSDVVDGTAEGIICMTQILEGLVSGE